MSKLAQPNGDISRKIRDTVGIAALSALGTAGGATGATASDAGEEHWSGQLRAPAVGEVTRSSLATSETLTPNFHQVKGVPVCQGKFNGSVSGLVSADKGIFAIGSFNSVSGVPAQGVAYWDGKIWQGITGQLIGHGPPASVAGGLVTHDNRVIVYGDFISIVGSDGITRQAGGIAEVVDGELKPFHPFREECIITSAVEVGDCIVAAGRRVVGEGDVFVPVLDLIRPSGEIENLLLPDIDGYISQVNLISLPGKTPYIVVSGSFSMLALDWPAKNMVRFNAPIIDGRVAIQPPYSMGELNAPASGCIALPSGDLLAFGDFTSQKEHDGSAGEPLPNGIALWKTNRSNTWHNVELPEGISGHPTCMVLTENGDLCFGTQNGEFLIGQLSSDGARITGPLQKFQLGEGQVSFIEQIDPHTLRVATSGGELWQFSNLPVPSENVALVFPNPSHRGGVVTLVLNESQPGTVFQITSVDGRLVRSLPSTEALTLIWDGLDQAGEHTPSGVYFVTADRGDILGKIVIMK